MGQRSQYIFEVNAITHENKVRTIRKAGHFQWVYGALMAQRSGQVIRYLLNAAERGTLRYVGQENLVQGMTAMIGVNHVTGEVQGLDPWDDVSAYGADDFDNNNGLFLVSVTLDERRRFEEGYVPEWSFGYVIGGENGGDMSTVVTLKDYAEPFGEMFAEYRGAKNSTPADVMTTAAFEALYCEITNAEAAGHHMDQTTADRLMETPVKAPENLTPYTYALAEEKKTGYLWVVPGIEAPEKTPQQA